MKKTLALILAVLLCLSAAGCTSSAGQAQTGASAAPEETEVHKIGVIVYNTGDEEVIGFREYLQGYIESNFEMVKFVYSNSIGSSEEELQFIQSACDQGVEGFLSFLSYDLSAEVALCGQNKAYYVLASGTVSDEDFESVADNPWFLGMFGPGTDNEFQAGTDMTRYFVREKAGRFFVLTGGAALGNEMHYQRTLGILDTLEDTFGFVFPEGCEKLAETPVPVTVDHGSASVTLFPGYLSDEAVEQAAKAFAQGSYDAVLSVLPPQDLAMSIGKTPLGVVDSFNTRNLQLVTNGTLKFVVGKSSSIIGPAFALMLNAVTGYAEDFRDNGRAIKVTQGFWTAQSRQEYVDKYTLSASAAMNAYNFKDLSQVIRIYNPDAQLSELVALAEACSFWSVVARRNAS